MECPTEERLFFHLKILNLDRPFIIPNVWFYVLTPNKWSKSNQGVIQTIIKINEPKERKFVFLICPVFFFQIKVNV